jgi:hypothetical protein
MTDSPAGISTSPTRTGSEVKRSVATCAGLVKQSPHPVPDQVHRAGLPGAGDGEVRSDVLRGRGDSVAGCRIGSLARGGSTVPPRPGS